MESKVFEEAKTSIESKFALGKTYTNLASNSDFKKLIEYYTETAPMITLNRYLTNGIAKETLDETLLGVKQFKTFLNSLENLEEHSKLELDELVKIYNEEEGQ